MEMKIIDDLYAALRQSQQWIAKLAADHSEDYLAGSAMRRYNGNEVVLGKVKDWWHGEEY